MKDTWPFVKWWTVCFAGLSLAVWGLNVFLSTETREWLALPYAIGGLAALAYGFIRLVSVADKGR